jgi:predicted transcriptional regulator
MTKNRLTVSKHILVDETLDNKLEELANAHYTNQSTVVRLLISKEYEQYKQQVRSIGEIGR